MGKENKGKFLTSGGRYLVTEPSNDYDVNPALPQPGSAHWLKSLTFLQSQIRLLLTQETSEVSNYYPWKITLAWATLPAHPVVCMWACHTLPIQSHWLWWQYPSMVVYLSRAQGICICIPHSSGYLLVSSICEWNAVLHNPIQAESSRVLVVFKKNFLFMNDHVGTKVRWNEERTLTLPMFKRRARPSNLSPLQRPLVLLMRNKCSTTFCSQATPSSRT